MQILKTPYFWIVLNLQTPCAPTKWVRMSIVTTKWRAIPLHPKTTKKCPRNKEIVLLLLRQQDQQQPSWLWQVYQASYLCQPSVLTSSVLLKLKSLRMGPPLDLTQKRSKPSFFSKDSNKEKIKDQNANLEDSLLLNLQTPVAPTKWLKLSIVTTKWRAFIFPIQLPPHWQR